MKKHKQKHSHWTVNPAWAKNQEKSDMEEWNKTREVPANFLQKLEEVLAGSNSLLMVDIETLDTTKTAFPWAVGVVQFECDQVRGAVTSNNSLNVQTYLHPKLLVEYANEFDYSKATLEFLTENNTDDWPLYKKFLQVVLKSPDDEEAVAKAEQQFLQDIQDYMSKKVDDGAVLGSVRVSLIDNLHGLLNSLGAIGSKDQAEYASQYRKHQVLMSKGKDFDFPILENCIKVLGGKVPWHYRNTDDMRGHMHELHRLATTASVMVANQQVLGIEDYVPILESQIESALDILQHKEVSHLANFDCHVQISLLNVIMTIQEGMSTLIAGIYEVCANRSEEADDDTADAEDVFVNPLARTITSED